MGIGSSHCGVYKAIIVNSITRTKTSSVCNVYTCTSIVICDRNPSRGKHLAEQNIAKVYCIF